MPDGIFDSIKELKTEPILETDGQIDLPNFEEEYNYILDICSARKKIPSFTYID